MTARLRRAATMGVVVLGAVLLTGAGIVPPDSFTLEGADSVRITVSGIGTLENPVAIV